jgi:hypothetical protein
VPQLANRPIEIIRRDRLRASNATRTSTTTNPTKIPATKEEQVNLSRLLMIAAITLVGSDYAVAQSLKDQLAGTWLLVSNVNVAPVSIPSPSRANKQRDEPALERRNQVGGLAHGLVLLPRERTNPIAGAATLAHHPR